MTGSTDLPKSGQRLAAPLNFTLHATPEQRKRIFERCKQLRENVQHLAWAATVEYSGMERLATDTKKELDEILNLILYSMVDDLFLEFKAQCDPVKYAALWEEDDQDDLGDEA